MIGLYNGFCLCILQYRWGKLKLYCEKCWIIPEGPTSVICELICKGKQNGINILTSPVVYDNVTSKYSDRINKTTSNRNLGRTKFRHKKCPPKYVFSYLFPRLFFFFFTLYLYISISMEIFFFCITRVQKNWIF